MCSVLYSLRPYQRKQSVHTSKLSRALDALHCRTMPCQTSNRGRLWQGRGSRPQLELTSRPDPAADDICRTPQNKGSWTPMRSRHLLMLSIHCCAPGSLSFHSIALLFWRRTIRDVPHNIGVDSVHCLARRSRHPRVAMYYTDARPKRLDLGSRPQVSLAAHRLRARSVGAARAARGKAPGGIPAQSFNQPNPTCCSIVLYCRPVANLVVQCTT